MGWASATSLKPIKSENWYKKGISLPDAFCKEAQKPVFDRRQDKTGFFKSARQQRVDKGFSVPKNHKRRLTDRAATA
jgi:hypothetical protein